jgi:hypothetical protein
LFIRDRLAAVPAPAEIEAATTGASPEPDSSPGAAPAATPPTRAAVSPRRPRGQSKRPTRGAGPSKAERIRVWAVTERAEGRTPVAGDAARALQVDKAQARRVIAALPAPNGKAPEGIEGGRS